MNMIYGKTSYASKKEAEAAASRMSRKFSEPFTAYNSKGQWYVGGRFIKQRPIVKVKSLVDLKDAWSQFKEHQADTNISDYIEEVKESAANTSQQSLLKGDDGIWTLLSFSERLGTDLNFRNSKTYLVLEISNGIETIHPKMGGAFSRHIPLMKKVAESLIDQPIVWSTWNKVGQNKWSENEWFYRLDLNEELAIAGRD